MTNRELFRQVRDKSGCPLWLLKDLGFEDSVDDLVDAESEEEFEDEQATIVDQLNSQIYYLTRLKEVVAALNFAQCTDNSDE